MRDRDQWPWLESSCPQSLVCPNCAKQPPISGSRNGTSVPHGDRVVEGYGTVIAAHGEGLPVVLDSPARRIDHSRRRLHVATADGAVTADAAIVTLPSALLDAVARPLGSA
jgi:hypothetical protein